MRAYYGYYEGGMNMKRLYLINNLMRNAHPLEPFPCYKPFTKKDKIVWFFIKLRWKIISSFVKYKSKLNDKSIK